MHLCGSLAKATETETLKKFYSVEYITFNVTDAIRKLKIAEIIFKQLAFVTLP
jgi:hypothetical protein